jgi:hypothetical protein
MPGTIRTGVQSHSDELGIGTASRVAYNSKSTPWLDARGRFLLKTGNCFDSTRKTVESVNRLEI